jgi:hypothetical protein
MPTWMTSFHHLLSVARLFQEARPWKALLGPMQEPRPMARARANRGFFFIVEMRTRARTGGYCRPEAPGNELIAAVMVRMRTRRSGGHP